LPIAGASSALRGHGLREGTLDGNHLQLPRYGALFARFETVDAQPDFAATAMGASS
jgi:hypothetical protein